MKSSIRDWKERSEAVQTLRTTASVQIERGPCLLIGISVCCWSASSGSVSLYDGLGTGAKNVFDLTVAASVTRAQEFHPPITLRQGLYLTLAGGLASVTVRYVPIKD